MEMLYKCGKVVDREYKKKKIYFEMEDICIENAFCESVDYVVSWFFAYDLEKFGVVDDREIYYLYDSRQNKNAISSVIECNSWDIVRENIDDNDKKIFWDVINHVVVIIGKDSLAPLIGSIEQARWEPLSNDGKFREKVAEDELSPVYRKVKKSELN